MDENLKSTEWKRFSYKDNKILPTGVDVEICIDPQEKVIEFDPKYSNSYFLDEPGKNRVKPENEPVGLNKTREWVEDLIFDVCNHSTLDDIDIIRILAWKTGRIRYGECAAGKNDKSHSGIIYFSNWNEDKEKMSFQMPKQKECVYKIEIDEMTHELRTIQKNYLKEKSAEKAWKMLVELSKKDYMRGIGTVYLITLFHFITKQDYPIYDRFAMAALVAWKLKKYDVLLTKDSIVSGCSLPDKKAESTKNILNIGKYAEYIELLNEFCRELYPGDSWKHNRDIDRALWVYGHFFKAI